MKRSAPPAAKAVARAPRERAAAQPASQPHVAGEAVRGKYVYCVIQSADPLRFGAAGIGDNGTEIHTVHYRDLAAVVSEGAGSRSVGEVREMPGIGLPMQVVETVITAGNTLFSNSPPPPLMQDIIGRIAPRPVFIIWTRNGVDTEALNPVYYEAAGAPKTLWEIPESKHVGGLQARPREYERRVVGFFDDALLRSGAHAPTTVTCRFA